MTGRNRSSRFDVVGAILAAALAATLCLAACAPETASVQNDGHSAEFTEYAVACDHPAASQAGAEMLAQGGNAVDAAVAASFCLSVVRPFSCGIGGGGFMVILLPPDDDHAAPRTVALDYREICPAAVGPDYFAALPEGASERGPHACAVPGAVRGLLMALERYGTLDRTAVLAPAIRAAREGFLADESHVEAAAELDEVYRERPTLRPRLKAAWRRFTHEGTIEPGGRIVNPDQARALELIAAQGDIAFYKGPIAEAIVRAMTPGDGPITRDDLASYHVRRRQPLIGSFGGLSMISMPPPSSGGVALQQIFELLDRLGALDPPADRDDPAWSHLLVEACKHAFADRARWLADDAFVTVPLDSLLAPAYLDELAARIDPDATGPADEYGSAPPLPEDSGTSHISVLDAGGMAVGCTETINLYWGSCVEVPGFGFFLNDEMDDFTTSDGANAFGLVQSDRNRPEPGKRPLSSMSPTIFLDGTRPVAIAGASGGPRIITGTLQVLLSALVFGDDAGRAVARPRLHHQWQPDYVRVERSWTDDRILDGLRERGHEVRFRDGSVGVVQAIIVRDGVITAASDPRKGGRPAGR